MRVSLRRIVGEIDALPDGWTAYINRATGEVYSFSDDEGDVYLDDEAGGDQDTGGADLADWEREHQAMVRAVVGSNEWVALPSHFDVHEWSIMQTFSQSVTDEGLRDELVRAIHGPGAFRYFKDTIHRHGIQQAWYRYKEAAIAGLVADRLRREGIDFDADIGSTSTGETPN